jgi:hypothetical protein
MEAIMEGCHSNKPEKFRSVKPFFIFGDSRNSAIFSEKHFVIDDFVICDRIL